MRNVKWIGDSRERLRSFPKPAREAIGEALRIAQTGGKHQKAKPLIGVGSGVFEIAARYDTNTYRTVYTVKLGENIYVLHVFQKKSTRGIRTPKKEIDLIKQRLGIAREMEAKNE
ncbi:type II toxin-antitoxin system RelE/ParE family toxin [Candidatus Poribacteria bacterium]|nr:type II toxin-antitoxin system RelE/ParE family toxin [Gammaproteobacteria bacterium]MXV82267.1 type II toxin-antitoxin system RelE/ParE family toxin [Candidatus Poribacteria bacterium]MYA57909.1 type II toxin-antitoxin system RelE/ParE family toxin [Candidatus Poribacteria bacterium]